MGKLVRGSLYVHQGAVHLLGGERRERVRRAAALASTAVWNVARLDATAICLLEYEDFETVAFPRLLAATLVDASKGTVALRNYRSSPNSLILHRKELLVHPADPRRAAWEALSAELAGHGLFADGNRIGRERHWEGLLLRAGFGHLLRSP